MTISITHLNGSPATADSLTPLAFAGFAHFTAMQVRGGGVRGLDLHLDRLRLASDELFGTHLPDEQVRAHLRTAASAAGPDCSLTCYLTARPGEFQQADGASSIDVLVKAGDPAAPPAGPLALDLVEHERHLPHLKHVGEITKTVALRQAVAQGFDDAAFRDRRGHLSEATIWNLAFWDGRSVIWPQAAMLRGVTMQILSRRLTERGVRQRSATLLEADLDGLSGVVLNSWSPAIALSRIGNLTLSDASELVQLLHTAYDSEPAETF